MRTIWLHNINTDKEGINVYTDNIPQPQLIKSITCKPKPHNKLPQMLFVFFNFILCKYV